MCIKDIHFNEVEIAKLKTTCSPYCNWHMHQTSSFLNIYDLGMILMKSEIFIVLFLHNSFLVQLHLVEEL